MKLEAEDGLELSQSDIEIGRRNIEGHHIMKQKDFQSMVICL